MTYDTFISMIQHFGYLTLFFALWLGIVGMPIPDEVIVMAGGAVTSAGLLKPVPAFILTYLGVVSGLSIGYFLGRFLGTPILEKIRRKKNMDKYLVKSENLIRKYGDLALFISYFFPVVRHILPYIVGLNKMSFRRYASISYPTGFIWTLLIFIAGRLIGSHAGEAGTLVYQYGLRLLGAAFMILLFYALIRFSKKYNDNKTI